jgi:WD40 repeat protein
MRKGDFDLYVKDVLSNEPAKAFLATDLDDSPMGWVPPDGKMMLISQSTPDGRYPVQLVNVADPRKMTTLADEPLLELVSPSPDGRWLAMVLTRGGRQDVFVQPLFKDGAGVQVSTKGGQAVAWSPRTRELLYARPPDIVAVPYKEENGQFAAGPERLFARVDGALPDYVFEAAPDGRILVQVPSSPPAAQIRVILDFGRVLERQFNAR